MYQLKRGLRLFTQPRRLMGRLLGPRALVTGVPKAGTNMLVHTLSLFPQLRVAGTVSVLPSERQSTHHPTDPALDVVLDRQDIKVVFISRDPRDVCVSLYHYMMREPGLGVYHTYYQRLPDDHSRLMMAITGIEEASVKDQKIGWPSVDTIFRERLSWFAHPRCCMVTFEETDGYILQWADWQLAPRNVGKA